MLQEEEHKRVEAIRQRELDAAEQLHQKRLADELRYVYNIFICKEHVRLSVSHIKQYQFYC